MSLEVRKKVVDQGVLKLDLSGRLDSSTASDFDDTLTAGVQPDVKALVLDLADLEYLSSAGIRSLFTARMTMESQGGRLFLLAPQPDVRKVLDMVRVIDAETILDGNEALERLLA